MRVGLVRKGKTVQQFGREISRSHRAGAHDERKQLHLQKLIKRKYTWLHQIDDVKFLIQYGLLNLVSRTHHRKSQFLINHHYLTQQSKMIIQLRVTQIVQKKIINKLTIDHQVQLLQKFHDILIQIGKGPEMER